MPELGSYGSVRGAAGNSRPYRERRQQRDTPHAQRAGVQTPVQQLCARRISDAGDPIKPRLREDIFSVRRRMPSAAHQSSIRCSLQRNDSDCCVAHRELGPKAG